MPRLNNSQSPDICLECYYQDFRDAVLDSDQPNYGNDLTAYCCNCGTLLHWGDSLVSREVVPIDPEITVLLDICKKRETR